MKHLWFHKLFRTKKYERHMIDERRKREAIEIADRMRLQRLMTEERRAAHARAEARYGRVSLTKRDQSTDQGLAYASMDEPWTPGFHHHKAQDDAPVYHGASGTFDGAGASSDWSSSSSSDSCSSSSSSSDSGSSSSSCSSD